MNKEIIVDDLVQIVKRLAHSLRKVAPDNDLPDKALDYLKCKDLLGSPFRIQACREADREMAATTTGSEMINAAIQALNTETPNPTLKQSAAMKDNKHNGIRAALCLSVGLGLLWQKDRI